MVEMDTEPVTSRESLVPVRAVAPSLIEKWVEGDTEKAVERMNTMVRMLEELRKAAIRSTYASDWIVHTTTDRDGNVVKQVGYLQDIGAERAAKCWGIEIGQPAIEREDFPDGTYSYHMIADAWSKVTGERLDYAEGSRWSGDDFFARQVKKEGDKIDPTDVRKAAYANLHGRAVRSLSGLNGVPLDMLKAAGVDVGRVVHVTYGGGTSSSGVGTSEMTIRWGNAKGKKLAELSEKDLAYYLTAEEKNLADPAKERFRKSTQTMVDALKGERDRRTKSAEQATETGTAAPEKPTDRAGKLTALHARLGTALGTDKRSMPKLLRSLTAELGAAKDSMQDLTEEDLDRLFATPDGVIEEHVAGLKEAK